MPTWPPPSERMASVLAKPCASSDEMAGQYVRNAIAVPTAMLRQRQLAGGLSQRNLFDFLSQTPGRGDKEQQKDNCDHGVSL